MWKNLTRITGTFHEDRYTFLIISRSVLLRMRNVSDKICTENQNTHFGFCNSPLPPLHSPKNRTVYEIKWKNITDPVRPQMTIRRMRFACKITKDTGTHSE